MRYLTPLLAGACLTSCASGAPGPAATTIVNAVIIDGTGAPGFRGALRYRGDSIVAVGADVTPQAGDSVIDAGGLVLAPGFIDSHSHHDRFLTRTPDARAAVSQGITTIIAGQDGGHPIPLARAWDSIGAVGTAVNVAFYAGHGSIRHAVMGSDFRRPATAAEVDSMAVLLRAELDAGALGLSAGLEYDPGIYSDRSEVLALAKVAAAAGSRYLSHIRSEDRWFWEAIDEIITIGREARLPVQISHVKLAMIPLWGQADSLIRVLDRARASGIDITADIYPYPYWQSTLTVLFPKRDFDNRAEAERILRELARPEGLLIGDFGPNPAYRGRTVAEIAVMRGEDPAATLMGLIRESLAANPNRLEVETGASPTAVESVVATSMAEPDIDRLMAWPHTNICSDGMLDGAHPRGFGAFPRVLGRYVREKGVLTLEDAVRKMTSLTAAHVGLTGMGTLAPGRPADLVLFDPATVLDQSTPAEPHVVSTGVSRVWVGGVPVWADGATTGARPGRMIKRPRPS